MNDLGTQESPLSALAHKCRHTTPGSLVPIIPSSINCSVGIATDFLHVASFGMLVMSIAAMSLVYMI